MYECAAHEAKHLCMEMQDLGTRGDGDNKPEAFQRQWEVSLCTRIEIHLKITAFDMKEEVPVCAGVAGEKGGGSVRFFFAVHVWSCSWYFMCV